MKIITDSDTSTSVWNTDVRPGSLGYIAGANTYLDSDEVKKLKRCLGDSDFDPDNNVDVQNWDHAFVSETDGGGTYKMIGAFPHAIKIVPKETNSNYNKFSYGSYHLVWYDDTASAGKEFRLANIDENYRDINLSGTECYLYTTKGTVQQLGYGAAPATEIANDAGGSSRTRIVGYFDAYTNRIYTNYDTSCENQPTSGNRNYQCVEKGDKLFVVDGCWGGGDRTGGVTNPIFGGPSVFNCADSTAPTANTGNIYTVTKVGVL